MPSTQHVWLDQATQIDGDPDQREISMLDGRVRAEMAGCSFHPSELNGSSDLADMSVRTMLKRRSTRPEGNLLCV
jgi:hypothetical protein